MLFKNVMNLDKGCVEFFRLSWKSFQKFEIIFKVEQRKIYIIYLNNICTYYYIKEKVLKGSDF